VIIACFCDDTLPEALCAVRYKAGIHMRAGFDPIRFCAPRGETCEQHLLTAVHRNINFAVDAVPRDSPFSGTFAGGTDWRSAETERHLSG